VIPAIGLGTWPLVGEECASVVDRALRLGWRLLDTSEQYGNEDAVGEGLRRSGVPRAEVWVTTKLNVRWHGRALAVEGLRAGLARLGLEHVDLALIHWPNPWLDRYVDAWRGLLDARDAGLARHVGVSNFTPAHLQRLLEETGEAPWLDQIELDPTLPRREERAWHAAHGVVTQAWSPLGRAGPVLRHPVVLAIAARHGVSAAQVVLRWHVQQGVRVVVGASSERELREDRDLDGFALSDAELAALDALDEGRAPRRDPEEHGH
jgi:2,5-diketo-D-gluconate reductase A